MSVLCSTNCGALPTPVDSYFACNDVFRDFGANHFILVKCNYQFTDITDDTEWSAAVVSGDVKISPPGKLVQAPPNQSVIEIEGCGREVAAEIEHIFDFETYQTADDMTDYDYWADIFSNFGSYRIIPVHCDARFMMENEFVTHALGGGVPAAGTNPGFEFSVTSVPHEEEGEGGYTKWMTQFKVKRGQDNAVLKAAPLVDVLAAIG